jgi:peptide/nickel transport system permease protein
VASDPTHQDLALSFSPPDVMRHPFGTDQFGRDELSRVLSATRVSISVSVASLVVAGVVGVMIGLVSGYFGGAVEVVLMRALDVQMSIPGILLVITVATVLGPKISSVLLVLALYAWVMYARVIRAEVLSVRERAYITAARSLGGSPWWILRKHVLRNVTSSIIIITTLQLPSLIIIQASLGYLGLGIPPPSSDLGAMVAEGQKFLTTGEWWVTLVPGMVIASIVLAINALGDWVRDFFDPRARLGKER